jgi:hypothetical protein
MSEQGKQRCCYDYYGIGQKPELPAMPDDCPGVLATASEQGFSPEGYYIQVCPRVSWLGRVAGGVNFCGNGPDVIVLHRDTVPSKQEYQAVVQEVDDDWCW